MSEGFPFPGGEGTEGQDAAQLHAAMARATAHISPVRVDPARLRRVQRRHRLSEGGVVAGVLSVALVAATIAMQGGGGTTKSTVPGGAVKTSPSHTATSAPPSNIVVPTDVSVYDSDDGSEGKGPENQLLSGRGTWQTRLYCQDFATVRGLRKSTGLVFDLGAATHLGTVTVGVGIPGASMELWASDSSAPQSVVVREGEPPAGFTKVASVSNIGPTNIFTLTGVTTRYVLVWFTGALPAVPNADQSIHCRNDDGHRYGDSITAVRFTRG